MLWKFLAWIMSKNSLNGKNGLKMKINSVDFLSLYPSVIENTGVSISSITGKTL